MVPHFVVDVGQKGVRDPGMDALHMVMCVDCLRAAEVAADLDVRLMVDAEQTYFQVWCSVWLRAVVLVQL